STARSTVTSTPPSDSNSRSARAWTATCITRCSKWPAVRRSTARWCIAAMRRCASVTSRPSATTKSRPARWPRLETRALRHDLESMNESSPSYLDAAEAVPVFTAAAAHKVRELIAEEGNPDLKLRVYIRRGGCSCFQFCFSVAEERDEQLLASDRVCVVLLVDLLSLQSLGGAEIEYSENLTGARFVIRNPYAR